jgi:hypothetical protein
MVHLTVVSAAALPRHRLAARYVLRRTAVIVLTAQRFARQGKQFTGLGLAVAHQLYARKLYDSGLFLEAIHHSFRARVLAIGVIRLNKNELLDEAVYDRFEQPLAGQGPPDSALDEKVKPLEARIKSDQAASEILIDTEFE